MREIKADLFTITNNTGKNVWKLISTNGHVRSDGACVMGRGVALQFKERFPFAPFTLGLQILTGGNVPHVIGYWEFVYWLSFPVKHNYNDKKADYQLITMSAMRMKKMISWAKPDMVILPKVGCGCGKLEWNRVKACLDLDNWQTEVVVVEYSDD